MRRFSNFRYCERNDCYGFHGDRDNNSEFRIRATFEANNVENALATDAEFPLLFALALLLAGSMVAARNSRRRLVPVLALLIVSLVWITSCGGGGSNVAVVETLDTLGHSDNHRYFKRCEPLRFR